MNIAEKPRDFAGPIDASQWADARKKDYQRAKEEWAEVFGGAVDASQRWRLTALLSMLANLAAITAVILLLQQSRIVPYVVQIDKLGTVAAVGPAEPLARADNTVITAQLDRWIRAIRTVYIDAAAQRSLINEGYAMIDRNGTAYSVLNDYMRSNNPFERAADESVSVEVQSVLPIDSKNWRIEWREESRGRDGQVKTSAQYQANVTIVFTPPRDEQTIRSNPIGLYINEFHWARRL